MDFRPSDVRLGIPPLVGTMGRAELEHAAALFVRTLAYHGDEWGSLSPDQMAEMIEADIEENRDPFFSLNTNPFFKPNFRALVASEFAEWEDQEARLARFTPAGREALRKYVG